MNGKIWKAVKYGISIVIATLCIWMVARKVDWTAFRDDLVLTRWSYILLFIATSVLALVFRTFRWHDLLRPLGGKSNGLDIWDALNVGNLANVALPGAGEFIRCGYVSDKKATFDKSFGTILMERLWDILAIAVLIVLALTFKWNTIGDFLSENITGPLMRSINDKGGTLVICLVAVLVIGTCAAAVRAIWHFRGSNRFCGKIAGLLSGTFQGFASFFRMEHKLRFALFTAGVWAMYVLMSWFALKAVPVLGDLTLADALFISAIGNLAAVIPVPSGMGPYHYLIMITLTGLYGMTGEVGLLYAVLCHETHAILIILLGAVSYARLTISRNTQK